MQIAIVHPYAVAPGQEASASLVIERDRILGALLEQRGHQVRGLRATRSSSPVVIREPGRPAWEYYPLDRNALAPSQPPTSSQLLRQLTSWVPDVVILKGAGSHLGWQVHQSHAGPFFVILGGNYTDKLLHRSDLILTETAQQERYLAKRVGRKRLQRLPKLASELFSPGLDDSKQYDVVVISKFEPHKNHGALVPLLDHPISIALVGSGSLHAAFEAECESKLAQTHFLGALSPAEVAEVLRRSRLLVHPSLSEGFPRAAVEAMASGVPVVGLTGVIGEPIVDDVNGRLVSEAELADATTAILNDEVALQRYSAAARATYEAVYSLEALEHAVEAIDAAVLELVTYPTKRRVRRFLGAARGAARDLPSDAYRMLRRTLRPYLTRSSPSETPLSSHPPETS